MKEDLSDKLTQALDSVEYNYYKLVIIVVSSEVCIEEKVLQDISKTTNYKLVNVNLELSSRLVELSVKERARKAGDIMKEILRDDKSGTLLYGIEILFDTTLQLEPLTLLKNISRDKILIVVWKGYLENKRLYYAEPNHPEHKTYPIDDLVILRASANQTSNCDGEM